MASKKLSSDTSLANSYKLSRGVASVARPSAPTIGTATDGGNGLMSVTFTASTLGPTASSFTLTSLSGLSVSGASSPLTLQEVEIGTYTYSVSGINANGTGPSSAASNSVVVASVDSSAYFPIQTTTLATASASVSFTSIPSDYKHLQIRGWVKYTPTGNDRSAVTVRFNSDSGSNYNHGALYGTGTNIYSDQAINQSATRLASVAAPSSASNYTSTFGMFVADILDYANTNKYKTIMGIGGYDSNSNTYSNVAMQSGGWLSTAAITSMAITPDSGNWSVGSQFTLYGVKG